MSASEQTHPDPRAWEGWETPPGVPDSGLLELLAADAAGRAAAMLAGSATGAIVTVDPLTVDPLTEDPLVDAVRMLATAAGAPHAAAATVRRRRAFAAGELSVHTGEITDAWAGVRVRLGPDGRWHPSTLAREQWWPAVGANASAGAAYQAAVRARSLRRAGG